jgi:hypothetical protein
MNILRLGVALVIVAGLDAAAPVQPASTDQQLTSAQVPRTDHALGFYDLRLRRVVLVGGAGDPKQGDRDKVWSWSGTQWELMTDAGPPGRVNAGAAYDAGRGKAVVAGGSRKAMDGAAWEVVGDSWEEDRGVWQRTADIAPRDHQSLVEDNRGGILYVRRDSFSAVWSVADRYVGAARWNLEARLDRGPARPRPGGACLRWQTPARGAVRWRQRAARTHSAADVPSTTPGSGTVNAGTNKWRKAVRADDTLMGWCSMSARASCCSMVAPRRIAMRP